MKWRLCGGGEIDPPGVHASRHRPAPSGRQTGTPTSTNTVSGAALSRRPRGGDPLPGMAMGVTHDDDELARPKLSATSARASRRSTVEAVRRPRRGHHRDRGSRGPAAINASGSSSTTSGGRSSDSGPRREARAARPSGSPGAGLRRRAGSRAPRRACDAPAASRSRSSASSPSTRPRRRARSARATASTPRSWPSSSASTPAASASTAPSATPTVPADRLHLERVGDHEPVEAELLAEQAGETARLSVPARRRARARGRARS